jgi:hypothetical protein
MPAQNDFFLDYAASPSPVPITAFSAISSVALRGG